MEHIEPPVQSAKRLSKIRSRMAMDAAFFGGICMRMKVVWLPAVSTEVDTMATDGKHLFINVGYFDSLTDGQVRWVLIHEVLHVTDGHHLRMGKRDPKRWNIAADYAINPIVVEQCGNADMPEGGLLDSKYAGMSTEQIYGALKDEEQQPQSGDDQSGDDQSDGNQGDDNAQSEQSQSADPAGCGGVIAPTNDDGSALSVDQIEQAKTELAQTIAQAAQQAEKRGQLPGSLKELVKNARQAQVDWKERLWDNAKGSTITDYTWRSPNRRRLQDGIYLPSLLKEGAGEIVIGLDTSGSVSRDAFEQFAGEVLAICEEVQPSALHLLYCDTALHPESYEREDLDDIKIERKGGGGTSFVPVFDWVEDRIADGEDAPQCLIYLTDGYGSEPEYDPDYPVLWVCCSPKEMRIGETVRINA
jgi:predicted metal-dependent peptidase